MATKRTTASDPVASTGAAPARAKAKGARTHRAAAAAETSENAQVPSPVAAPPAPLAAESPATQPSFEEIAQLAYSYWESRGYQGGSPEDDWLRAEQEVRSQSAAGASA